MKTDLSFRRPLLQKLTALGLSLTMLGGAVSCKSWSREKTGALIGIGTGAAAGGYIGKNEGHTAVGVLIGAAVGGAAGALIGRYMDKQAAELKKDLPNATVERVGEGIKVTFKSGILFDYDSDKIKPQTAKNLDEMAQTLNKYADTKIMIDGYTDATGTEAYNQKLSERRAEAVRGYLRNKNVGRDRMDTKGFGETNPVADNGTEAGREKNRRVEVAIMADEKLKQAARKGEIAGL
jgi:outer membrane protein OmpA-like peptidoglycan-associated protein